MKNLLITFILCLALTSCHKEDKKKHHNVMTNQKSLVNSWYGKEHFEKAPPKQENESLNKLDNNEAVEVEAGKMTPNKTNPTEDTQAQASHIEQTENETSTESLEAAIEENMVIEVVTEPSTISNLGAFEEQAVEDSESLENSEKTSLEAKLPDIDEPDPFEVELDSNNLSNEQDQDINKFEENPLAEHIDFATN